MLKVNLCPTNNISDFISFGLDSTCQQSLDRKAFYAYFHTLQSSCFPALVSRLADAAIDHVIDCSSLETCPMRFCKNDRLHMQVMVEQLLVQWQVRYLAVDRQSIQVIDDSYYYCCCFHFDLMTAVVMLDKLHDDEAKAKLESAVAVVFLHHQLWPDLRSLLRVQTS